MNSNKIKNTKVGDDIHFYINGVEDRGIVVKMNNEYVTIFKESTQNYDDIHINDTFFVKDIMVNKEWDKCTDIERYDMLQKAHAPSPRYLMKSWDELPRDIKEVLRKNNGIEASHKDDDDMNTVTRIFDGKTETTKGEGGTGRKTNPESSLSEDANQAPDHKQGEKHRKDTVATMPKGGIADEHGGHRGVTSEESAKLERHNQHGDSNVRNQEVGNRKEKLEWERSGHGSSAAAQDLHNENKPDAVETRQEKQRGRNSQDKKGKEVLAGVSALKAWQLWLAKREEQINKKSRGDSLNPSSEAYQGRSQRMEERNDKWDNASEDQKKRATESGNKKFGGKEIDSDSHSPDSKWQASDDFGATPAKLDADKVSESSSKEIRSAGQGVKRQLSGELGNITQREGTGKQPNKKIEAGVSALKSIEEKLLELKSNVENSVHGNAARNPTSGVSTSTPFDAPKDYEGFSHSGKRSEQFKYEDKKPSVGQKLSKVNINIDGSDRPVKMDKQGTGEGGNKNDTAQQNNQVKGRASNQERDKKQ